VRVHRLRTTYKKFTFYTVISFLLTYIYSQLEFTYLEPVVQLTQSFYIITFLLIWYIFSCSSDIFVRTNFWPTISIPTCTSNYATNRMANIWTRQTPEIKPEISGVSWQSWPYGCAVCHVSV